MNELYWIWLQKCLGIGSRGMVAATAIMRQNDCDIKEFYSMSESRLQSFGFLTKSMLDRLEDKSLDRAKNILDTCFDKGINLLCYDDERYPDLLRNIYNPPAVLYYRGILPDICGRPCFGIVGTRKASNHGIACAQELAQRLCEAGGVVISGGAAGIDQAAHQGAIIAKGKTIAVLGCGVDVPYYPSGRDLRVLIEKHGAALSEFPPGTPPNAYNFPIRNRIISGLSLCVSVIEGAEKSGSIITANIAAEQGRDVFALPGYVGLANSRAVNSLLRDGAKPLVTPNDIIGEYISMYPNVLSFDKSNKPLGAPDYSRTELPDGTVEEDRLLDKEREESYRRATEIAARLKQPKAKVRKNTAKEQEDVPSETVFDNLLTDSFSAEARSIFDALGSNELSGEELSDITNIELSKVLVSLTELELYGAVVSLPGMRYKKA